MWEPLLTFLTSKYCLENASIRFDNKFIEEVPNVWRTAKIEVANTEDEESDEDDSEEENEESDEETKPKVLSPQESPKIFYNSFLRFLQLGCGGSPIQGYPTLIVILSTIPEEV